MTAAAPTEDTPMPDDPTPGSPEAIAAGCTCPETSNRNGSGANGDGEVFHVSVDCPVHAAMMEGEE